MGEVNTTQDIQYLHMASQYLCAAGKSFLPKAEDDSHTNMIWDATEETLWTQPLNEEGLKLGLNVAAYALDLFHPLSDLIASYPLKGARHLDIMNWMERERSFCGLDSAFTFELHYELPYTASFEDSFQFGAVAGDERSRQIELRSQADKALKALQQVLDGFNHGKARIWPHHFDTGLLLQSTKVDGLQLSLGLAMPDTVSSDWYYYLSGYHEGNPVQVADMQSLELGAWISDGFNGAVCSAEKADAAEATSFLSEAARVLESGLLLSKE
jgi:hypothetical protein